MRIMIRWMRAALLLALALLPLSLLPLAPLSADPREARLAYLQQVMGIGQIVEVMQEEGRAHGGEIAASLGFPDTPGWTSLVDRIYDAKSMRAVLDKGFAESFKDADPEPLIAFFESNTGAAIVQMEIAARRAFLDQQTEDTARAAYRDLPQDDALLQAVSGYIDANGLVDFNVQGGLNSSLMFYRGLIEGGAFQMDEAEVLREVWAEEPETRADTREWLFAFLTMAYRPLTPAQVQAYTDLSKTPEGKALNRALFAGFNQMYAEISFGLGLAAAGQMGGEEL